ncbi:hypothetical protein NA78x_001722 [Anatilimnocola sp. NA78]|uniref:hypothetical protein n=1 Tax=Anatilimnocola sp. NA78 TaxID=3415683 RepID=UPI003CE5B2EF
MRVAQASENKFDLLEPMENDLAAKLNNICKPKFFWEMLWYLIEPQAIEKKISAEQFGKLMAGACLREAKDKFFLEWADFFRQLQQEEMATALETLVELEAMRISEVSKHLKETGIIGKAKEAIREELIKRSGKLQESLESTRDPIPSDSSH